ncbi:YbaK/EbsC family protein [Bounagaea algeriensis]
MGELPERSKQVAKALAAAGVGGEVREMPDSTRTAADAAAALDCAVGAIANSLVFGTERGPVLVLASGAHRVDTSAVAEHTGWAPLQRATPEQVRDATGQAIGGVAPLGHPEPLPTAVDASLAEYPVVWAAAGTPRTVFPTSYEELLRITAGAGVAVR